MDRQLLIYGAHLSRFEGASVNECDSVCFASMEKEREGCSVEQTMSVPFVFNPRSAPCARSRRRRRPLVLATPKMAANLIESATDRALDRPI